MAKRKYRWSDGKLHSISEEAHKDHVAAREKRADRDKSLADRVKRDPKLLERALKDPGLRSKLPDKYLTSEQRKVRENRRFREDIADIDNPLSGDSLIDVARGLTDREFDPLEQDIGREEQRTRSQTAAEASRAGTYFADLGRQFGAALGAQGTQNAAAVQAAQAREAQTVGAVDQAAGEARDRAAHDAAVRGGNLQGDGLAQLAATQAQQKTQAATEGQAQAGAAQQFGDAQAAFLRGLQGATMQAGGETQGQIAARGGGALADLAAERTKLRTDRKGAFTDTLLKLRGTEADRAMTQRSLANDAEKAILDYKADIAQLKSRAQIERANRALKLRLTEMGLSQKEAQAEADRASREAISAADRSSHESESAADRASREQENAADRAQSDRNNRRNNANDGRGNSKDRIKNAAKRDDAIGMAEHYKRRRASREDALALLTEKYGSDFARVAIGAIYDGGAKPHLDALLAQRYGIHIPRKYRRKR